MTNEVHDLVKPFADQFVQGNIEAALNRHATKTSNGWKASPTAITVHPNLNVRVRGASLDAHIRGIADSIKANGFYEDKPLKVYVHELDGVDVLYLIDGHNRLEGAKTAIEEGLALDELPIVHTPPGTDMGDIMVSMAQGNGSRELSFLEEGVICKRLREEQGWTVRQIARRLGKSKTAVENMLKLCNAQKEIIDMVIDERTKPTEAVSAIKEFGDGAYEALLIGEQNRASAGSARVTAKHMPGAAFKQAVKRTALPMLSLVREMKTDPTYHKLSGQLREKFDEMLMQLQMIEAEGAARDAKAVEEMKAGGGSVPPDQHAAASVGKSNVAPFPTGRAKSREKQAA